MWMGATAPSAHGEKRVIVPIAIVSAAFFVLSVRLMRTAWDVEGAEGWLALFFLGTALALPMRVLSAEGLIGTPELVGTLALMSHFMQGAALCGYTFFIERVFRGEELWARCLVGGVVTLELMAPLVVIVFGGHRDELHPVGFALGLIRVLPFLWGFTEVLIYYRKMKRRLALGLADPVVTNRFALFAIWNGALFVLPLLVVGVRAWAVVATDGAGLLGSGPTSQFYLNTMRAGLLLVAGTAAIAAYLSFYPPKAFVERVRRGAVTET